MNPYDELGLSSDATDEEIKQKYRELAHEHHPDKGGDEEIFKRIKAAYEILSDPIRRKEYDITGSADVTIRNDAIENIKRMIAQIVPNIKDTDNLIDILNNEIINAKNSVDADIQNCKRSLAHLQHVNLKINVKNDRQNLLSDALQMQIDQRNTDIDTFKRRIEICNLMLEILKDYEYGFIERVSIENGGSGET